MRHWLAIVSAVLMVSGCYTFYRMAPNEHIPSEATVAIAFAEPRDLEVRQAATVHALPAVAKVYGELECVRGDTLVLRALEIESSERRQELPVEARLTIVPGASAQLTTLRLEKGLTIIVTGLTVIGVFVLWFATADW